MNSEYFEGKVEKVETEEKPFKKQIGWFKRIEGTETKYYAVCSTAIRNFFFRIEVTEEKFKRIEAGQSVSLNLKFSFNFVCFHCRPCEEPKPKIMEVKRTIYGIE